MLRIIVGPREQFIDTADRKNMRVYPLLVKENSRFRPLAAKTDFSDVSDIELVIVRWYLPFVFWKVKLTPELKKGTLEFLRRYHVKGNMLFNCYSFACLVKGIDWGHRSGLWRKFWNIRRGCKKPKVGDVILLINEETKHFYHAAVYIGLGLYLSVYGGGGALAAATLKDMLKDYQAKDVVFVTPSE